MDKTNFENEGFFYINIRDTETFKMGEIRDIDMNIICPGVIVPIINPIRENLKEFESDTDKITFESYLPQITHYSRLIKGKKIRIYWDDIHSMFMVSSINRIYNFNDSQFNLSSVNFDLLDKKFCYYAICQDSDTTLFLTNIVDKENPSLEKSYNIEEDLAFENHLTIIEITDPLSELDKCDSYENGLIFVLQDGRQLEMRNVKYRYYFMIAKPQNISTSMYYIMCLNRNAEGNTFSKFYKSLHEYVNEYLYYYPEDTYIFNIMNKKLMHYIVKNEFTDDKDAIESIRELIDLPPEHTLQILY